jgi:cytochrome c553
MGWNVVVNAPLSEIITMRSTLLLLTFIGAAAAAGANELKPDVMVERAVHVCAACHGDSSENKSASIPNLNGQMPLYLEAQLKDFRTQKRAESDVQAYMWGISALLDDKTITGLAEFFAAQPAAPGITKDPALANQGSKIYTAGLPAKGVRPCQGCHGAKAEGASVFPRLAGQKSGYLVAQLEVFGTRLRPHGVLMKNEVAGLTSEQMRAVAEYLQSL